MMIQFNCTIMLSVQELKPRIRKKKEFPQDLWGMPGMYIE